MIEPPIRIGVNSDDCPAGEAEGGLAGADDVDKVAFLTVQASPAPFFCGVNRHSDQALLLRRGEGNLFDT